MAGKGKKTFVAGEVLLAQDVNDYLMDQTVMNFASDAARSSAIPTPTEGMLALSKDTQEINYYNGSAFVPALPIGAWQSWSPVFSGGWLNGNGTWDAKYVQIGKTVHFRGLFTAGSTSTMGSGMVISRPVTMSNIIDNNINVLLIQSTTRIAGFPLVGTTTTMTIGVSLANTTYVQFGAVSATAPFTWATGNQVYISGTYEAE
jgi:hypothetical protein